MNKLLMTFLVVLLIALMGCRKFTPVVSQEEGGGYYYSRYEYNHLETAGVTKDNHFFFADDTVTVNNVQFAVDSIKRYKLNALNYYTDSKLMFVLDSEGGGKIDVYLWYGKRGKQDYHLWLTYSNLKRY